MFRKHIADEAHPPSDSRAETCSFLCCSLWLLWILSASHHLVGPDSSSDLGWDLCPVSGLACTPLGTGIAIRVSHTLVGGPNRICRENVLVKKELKFPVFKQCSCPCKPLAPRVPEGETIAKHCTLTELAAPPVTCHSPEQLLQGEWVQGAEPGNSAGSASRYWPLHTQPT